MHCTNCGFQLEESDRFCPNCGANCEQVPFASEEITVQETVENAQPVMPQQAPASPKAAAYQPAVPKPKKVYHKTTGTQTALSVLVCLLAFVFGFLALTVGACRMTLKEDNIRSALEDGNMASMTVPTEDGPKTVTNLIKESIHDKTDSAIPIEDSWVRSVLGKGTVRRFVEELAVAIPRYVVFGEKSDVMDEDYIMDNLEDANDYLRRDLGYSITDESMDSIRDELEDGRLAFLTTSGINHYMKKQGVNLSLISALFSVWMLIVFTVFALFYLVLALIINSKNLPAGLCFSGITATVFGGLNLLAAIACVFVAIMENAFFISAMLKYLALSVGIISVIILAFGILLLLIRKPLQKNSVVV